MYKEIIQCTREREESQAQHSPQSSPRDWEGSGKFVEGQSKETFKVPSLGDRKRRKVSD